MGGEVVRGSQDSLDGESPDVVDCYGRLKSVAHCVTIDFHFVAQVTRRVHEV